MLTFHNQVIEFLRRVAEQLFQVTNKFIDKSFTVDFTNHVSCKVIMILVHIKNIFLDNSTVVIVTQGTTKLFVIHVWLVLSFAPQLRDHFRIVQFELALRSHP